MRALRNLDWIFLCTVLAMSLVGVAFIWSTTHWDPARDGLAGKQLEWLGAAILALIIVAALDYARLADLAYPAYIVTLGALALVLVYGHESRSAQRWIRLPGFTIQPSEFAKLTVVLALARYLRYKKDFHRWASLLAPLLIVFVPMALVLLQPDMGTALVFVPALFAMLYAAGVPRRKLMGLITAGVAAAPAMWFFVMKAPQRARITSFIRPEADPFGAGWHLRQSIAAVTSGDWAGNGFGTGSPVLLNRGFESHTDFIFAVIAHEWGFVGTLLVLALVFLYFSRGMEIASGTREPFGRLLVVGALAMLAFQTLVNIGMTLRLCPITGITLPFISYGGSSLLVCFLMAALVLSVGMRRKPFLEPQYHA